MTLFEPSDWLRSENFTNIMIEYHFNVTPWMLIFCIENANMLLEAKTFLRVTPLLHQAGQRYLSPHKRRQGTWCAWCAKLKPPKAGCFNTTKAVPPHAYYESAYFIEIYTGHLAINGQSKLTERVSEIGIEVMVSRVRLHYTRDYVTPSISKDQCK